MTLFLQRLSAICLGSSLVCRMPKSKSKKTVSARDCNVGPVPETDQQQLIGELKAWTMRTKEPFSFGAYADRRRPQAVLAKDLLKSSELLNTLFKVQTTGRFYQTMLSEVLEKLVTEDKKLNSSSFGAAYFAQWASKQILVMQISARGW